MTVSRKRYVAINNRNEILVDVKVDKKKKTPQEWMNAHWKPIEEIGNARVLSWATRKTAKAALRQCNYAYDTLIKIVEMTENIEFDSKSSSLIVHSC